MKTMIKIKRTVGWGKAVGALLCVPLLGNGCATHKPEPPPHERGWVGGQYKMVREFPKTLTPKPKRALLVTAVGTNTPVYAAGVRAGDLLLEMDHQPIKHLLDFRQSVETRKPGEAVELSAWREGQTNEYHVPVGHETFRHNGTFSVGLPGYVEGWQLWPTRDYPGFSLLVTGCKFSSGKRAELSTVENTYYRQCDPKHSVDDDNWKFWLAIFEIKKGENVLTQEKVEK